MAQLAYVELRLHFGLVSCIESPSDLPVNKLLPSMGQEREAVGSNPWPHWHPSLTRPDNRRFIHRINLPIEPQLVGLPEHLSGDGRQARSRKQRLHP